MIVADTNLVAYLVIPGAKTEAAMRARARDRDWIAPPFLRNELLNVIARYIAAGSLTRDKGLKAFRRALSVVKWSDRDADPLTILNDVASTNCSTYDAEFVWLARERRLSLVTADKEVLAAFPDVAIKIEDFAVGR